MSQTSPEPPLPSHPPIFSTRPPTSGVAYRPAFPEEATHISGLTRANGVSTPVKGAPQHDAIEAYLATARVHQERAIDDLLSELTTAINADASDTTLRLEYDARQLQLAIEHGACDAAAPCSVSLNTWCVWTLARAISKRSCRGEEPSDKTMQSRRRGRHGGRRGAHDGEPRIGAGDEKD